MRIIIVSDTHRQFFPLLNLIESHLSDVDHFIHLGDGLQEFEDVENLYPEKHFYSVPGNCDFGYNDPYINFLTLTENGKSYKIMYTHGHALSVKYSLDPALKIAEETSSHILLYGHTHQNFTDYKNNVYILNPGSLCLPRNSFKSYGVLDLTPAGIIPRIVQFK